MDNTIPFGEPPLFFLIALVVGKNLLSFGETLPIILSLGEPFSYHHRQQILGNQIKTYYVVRCRKLKPRQWYLIVNCRNEKSSQ
jgi:hypothetical protein